jgi:hypothetical protein
MPVIVWDAAELMEELITINSSTVILVRYSVLRETKKLGLNLPRRCTHRIDEGGDSGTHDTDLPL